MSQGINNQSTDVHIRLPISVKQQIQIEAIKEDRSFSKQLYLKYIKPVHKGENFDKG